MKNLKKISREDLKSVQGGIYKAPDYMYACGNITFCYNKEGDVMGGTDIPTFYYGSDVPEGAINVRVCGFEMIIPAPAGC